MLAHAAPEDRGWLALAMGVHHRVPEVVERPALSTPHRRRKCTR